jgi:hypothetical protein
MSRPILYLSFNDGSDMRVNKEVCTLSRIAPVVLMALGPDPLQCYARPHVHTLHFVRGKRMSAGTLLQYFARCLYLLATRRYHSVHIINEPQLMALWPLLWFQKHVVLDVFDSVFLRNNRPGNRWRLLKKIVYAPVSQLIVTDGNRLTLLPDFLQSKATIVPNYPYRLNGLPARERPPHLTIMYYGWLGEQRGTETIRHLLAADPSLHVLMAGWLADEPSRTLANHARVKWLGVVPQAEALGLVARHADYILCVYAPVNDNNINASPNKIFDAIQTRTPVIMNAEVKVADFVAQQQIGYVMPGYSCSDYARLAAELYQRRESYVFEEDLRQTYSWEKTEEALLEAHRYLS